MKTADGRGEGLGGIDVRAVDKAAVLAAARKQGIAVHGDGFDLAGVRFRLV